MQMAKSDSLMAKVQAESVERGGSRTIVAAVDESAAADDVFDFVCRHFNSPDTLLVFTHVAKPRDSLLHSFAAKASEAQAKEYLAEGWVKRAAELQMPMRCLGKVLVGDPREELCAFCDHLRPDALVMGSHGRRALSRVMLGSVSDYCVHFCCCPVIVVKPGKDHDDENGYSTVFRLAAKSLGMQHLLRDKTKAGAAGALEEIARKGEEGGEGGNIELEDVVLMDSPFPPSEPEAAVFPASEVPFAVDVAKEAGATATTREEEASAETGVQALKGGEGEVVEMESPFSPGKGAGPFPLSGSPFSGPITKAQVGAA